MLISRKQLCKNQHGNFKREENVPGNNIEVYEAAGTWMQRNLGASIARESFGIAIGIVSISVDIAKRALFYELGMTTEVFRLRNQFARDTALSGKETERIRFANFAPTKTRCVLALSQAKQILVPGWTESRHRFSVPCRTPTFTRRRAYVSADAVDDGFARLDKDETSLCQPSASNKMASFVVALRISTWHDSAFHPVWSFSLLAFENSAKFVSRNSAL